MIAGVETLRLCSDAILVLKSDNFFRLKRLLSFKLPSLWCYVPFSLIPPCPCQREQTGEAAS